MSYFPVTQICPFSNFIFARESVSLLVFSQCLLTLFRGVSCAWYAINFEGKVPDRVTAFRTCACGSFRGTFQISYDIWAFLHELYRTIIFFLNWKPQKEFIRQCMKGNAHQWLFRSLDLLSFRNLLCQLIAIQTLEKQGKLYSQLHWMKTSKVYFKRTLNSGKKELYVIVRQSSDRIRKAWQKWSPQQFRHQLRFPFRPDSFTPKNTQRKITPEFVTR